MNNKIMITSMLNSGTYFWMNFLKLHPEVSPRPYMAYMDFNKSFRNYKNTSGHENKKMIIQHHVADNGYFIPSVITLPTIWTMRDPLAAIISMHMRNQEHKWDSEWWNEFGNEKLSSFCCMIRINDVADNIMTSGVDLPMDTEQRKNVLRQGLNHMGLSPNENIVNSYGNSWIPANSKGSYRMKELYSSGNKEALKSTMGPVWGYLTSRESEMRLFLESVGYTNLLWWS